MTPSEYSQLKERINQLKIQQEVVKRDIESARAAIDETFGTGTTTAEAKEQLAVRQQELNQKMESFKEKVKEVEDALNSINS